MKTPGKRGNMTGKLWCAYSTAEYLDNLYRETDSQSAFKAKALEDHGGSVINIVQSGEAAHQC